jgi:hypothetical protein
MQLKKNPVKQALRNGRRKNIADAIKIAREG